MSTDLYHALLARGVPWPIAREAAASVSLDRDPRAQTMSLPEEVESDG